MNGGGGVQINYTNSEDKCGNPKTINRISMFNLKCDNSVNFALDGIFL